MQLEYARAPRWRRWLLCVDVLLVALPMWLYIQRHLERHPIPTLLQRLTAHASRHPLNMQACAAVATRLMVRGRRDQCLPRALLLYGLLLAGRPQAVRLCVGVQDPLPKGEPRFAHAWIEVDNQPALESTSPRRTHREIYCYPPRTAS